MVLPLKPNAHFHIWGVSRVFRGPVGIMLVDLVPSWGSLVPSWEDFGRLGSSWWFFPASLRPSSGHLGTLSDLCLAILEVLGAPWAILGCSSAPFGLRGVVLEVTWSISKLSGAFSGASLAIFRASRAILGDLRAILELTFSILHPLRAVSGRGLGTQNGAPVEA